MWKIWDFYYRLVYDIISKAIRIGRPNYMEQIIMASHMRSRIWGAMQGEVCKTGLVFLIAYAREARPTHRQAYVTVQKPIIKSFCSRLRFREIN